MAQHAFHPRLAQEINDLIFDTICGGTVISGRILAPPSLDLLTVSQTWYSHLIRYRYATFKYDSRPDEAEKLWGFLKTIASNPDNRFLVRNLHLTTMYLYDDTILPRNIQRAFAIIWAWGPRKFRWRRDHRQDTVLLPGETEPQTAQQIFRWLELVYLEPNQLVIKPEWRKVILRWYHMALYNKNKRWFESAMKRIGFHRGPGELFKKAGQCLSNGVPEAGYQCPLIAVLVGHCPELRRITAHVWHSEDDRWMDRIMNYATTPNRMWVAYSQFGARPPLQKLQRLHAAARKVMHFERVAGNDPTGRPVYDGVQYPFVVDNPGRDYWRLPALKDFMALSVTGHRSIQALNSASRIEQLMLNSRIMFQLHLSSWLRWCSGLRAFSIRLPADEFGSVSDPNEDNGPRLWNDLFTALRGVQDRLEYLDIYQQRIYPDTQSFANWFDVNAPAFCPPLPNFTALRQLNIPLTLLAGWRCTTHGHAQRMSSHLPLNIRTLGLYTMDPGTLRQIINPQDVRYELVNMVQTAAKNGLDCLVWDSSHARTQALEDGAMLAEANTRNLYVVNTDAADVLLCAGRETMPYYTMLDRSTEASVRNLVQGRRPWDVIPIGLTIHGIVGKMNHKAIPEVPPPPVLLAAAAAPLDVDDGDAMDIDE
ncbi:hypothetical protein BJX64DRAFT_288296 [Aspergillus heterothallicus]